MPDPLFIAVAVTAVLIVALAKSGLVGSLGLMGVPMLALVMPARDAAGMLLPLLLVMDAIAVWNYRRDFDARILRIMLPGAAIGTLVGWALWSFVSDAMVLLMVGVITLLFVLDEWLPLRKALPDRPPSRFWGRFWGAASGFTSFVSHTGSPPFQIYVLPQRPTPTVFAGTASWFFAIVNLAKLVPYFFLGQLSVSNLTLSAAMMPVAVAGMALGIFLMRRISPKLFYRLAYGLVLVIALKLIHDGVVDIFLSPAAA